MSLTAQYSSSSSHVKKKIRIASEKVSLRLTRQVKSLDPPCAKAVQRSYAVRRKTPDSAGSGELVAVKRLHVPREICLETPAIRLIISAEPTHLPRPVFAWTLSDAVLATWRCRSHIVAVLGAHASWKRLNLAAIPSLRGPLRIH